VTQQFSLSMGSGPAAPTLDGGVEVVVEEPDEVDAGVEQPSVKKICPRLR
jgi:hypothetical protein